MARTIKQFWGDMKDELGLAGYPASNERICKGWRSRALSSEKKLSMAVKALEDLVSAQDQLWTNINGKGLVDEAMDNAKQALLEIGVEHE